MLTRDGFVALFRNPHVVCYGLGAYFAVQAGTTHQQYRSLGWESELSVLRNPQDRQYVVLRGIIRGESIRNDLLTDRACLAVLNIKQTYFQEQATREIEVVRESGMTLTRTLPSKIERVPYWTYHETTLSTSLSLKLQNIEIMLKNPKKATIEGHKNWSSIEECSAIRSASSYFAFQGEASYSVSQNSIPSGDIVSVIGTLELFPSGRASITPSLITTKTVDDLRSEYSFMRKLYAILSCIFLYIGRKLQQWKYPPK
ncbi:MAG: hypothetical protein KFB95_06350 [Simkaniaceae bacterium]|nr:MAG: hypothetical protein KFB95_06350 [Simkaniaceae bacterium]